MKSYVTITLLATIYSEDVDASEDCTAQEFYKITEDYIKNSIDLIECATILGVNEVDIEVFDDEV